MYVYGQLIKADLENLSAAPSSPSRGRAYFDTTLGYPRIYLGSSWRRLIGDLNVQAKSANFTAAVDEDFYPCDATSAAFTATLPAPSSCSGKIFILKKIDNTLNAITIVAADSSLIDGAASQGLSNQWEILRLISNGSVWYIV